MPGGLIQLVASGAQDTMLTESPEITFFKASYRPYVNFAVEQFETQTSSGTVGFGNTALFTLERHADLVSNMYLRVVIPAVTAGASNDFQWARQLGHTLIDEVKLKIGGQVVDKLYGQWYMINNSLTLPTGKTAGYNEMIGNTTTMYLPSSTKPTKVLYIPLRFWFCDSKLALPIVALQYHKIEIEVKFRAVSTLYSATEAPSTGVPILGNVSLLTDYIYLQNQDRLTYIKNPQEYLIVQLQTTGAEHVTQASWKAELHFNHPCRELLWVVQLDSVAALNEWSNFTNLSGFSGTDLLDTAQLQLNGQDRFATREGSYFNLVQPYQHHTNIPDIGIYVYSFSLCPENYQPSGSLNFSRIDSASLNLNFNTITSSAPAKFYGYVQNYNLLRIASGLGGLAYAS
jgi:hypothetical protein